MIFIGLTVNTRHCHHLFEIQYLKLVSIMQAALAKASTFKARPYVINVIFYQLCTVQYINNSDHYLFH